MAQELEAEPTPEYQAVLNRSTSCGITNMPGNRPAYRDQNLRRQYADSPANLLMLGVRDADPQPVSWESLGPRQQLSGEWLLGCGTIVPQPPRMCSTRMRPSPPKALQSRPCFRDLAR
jgi:hypothetical protein